MRCAEGLFAGLGGIVFYGFVRRFRVRVGICRGLTLGRLPGGQLPRDFLHLCGAAGLAAAVGNRTALFGLALHLCEYGLRFALVVFRHLE